MGHKKINGPFQLPWASSISGPFVNNLYPNQALNVGAMSGTNTIYCAPQNVENFDAAVIQFSWTGTPTGNIVLAQSSDGIIWDDLILTPIITQPAGTAGHWSVDMTLGAVFFIQARYTNVSGSGVLTAKITEKDWN